MSTPAPVPVPPYEIVTITAVAQLPPLVGDKTTVLERLFDRMVVGSGTEHYGTEHAHVSYAQFHGEGAFGKTKHISLQLVVKSQLHPSYYVHAKIFNSGKVQMAGLKRQEHAMLTAVAICNSSRLAIEDDLKVSIVLINAKFQASRVPIDREVLHTFFLNNRNNISKFKLDSVYDPTHWPGIRLNIYFIDQDASLVSKRPQKVFVGIYRSGKAVVCGATTMNQIQDALQVVTFSVADSACADDGECHQRHCHRHRLENRVENVFMK